MPRPRIDYDAIAPLYDAQPHRARSLDPELEAFAAARGGAALSALDIGCGTGSQLIANRAALPGLSAVGLDRSPGMLRQARSKAPEIAWVLGDGAALPFRVRSFDFACCQFAFHHIADKPGMLREVLRALRPGGRFVLHNLCPQRSPDWLYYQFFPEARDRDFEDFWPPATITDTMTATGFTRLATTYKHIEIAQDLAAWLDVVRRRDTCSQLAAISDAAYRRGIERIEHDLGDPDRPRSRNNHLCLVTIHGEAPKGDDRSPKSS